VLLFADGSVKKRKSGFWKFSSHAIKKHEIEGLIETKPEVVIVGTGTNARARLGPDAESRPEQAMLELVVLPSSVGIERLNQLVDEGRCVAAVIHITC